MLHSARQLLRSPRFTWPAFTGLALGLAAATIIFSVYHALLLGSLGFGDLPRLVSLWPTDPQHRQQHVEVCFADWMEWRKRAPLLEDAALASSVNLDFRLNGDGPPQQVESTIVTGNFFRLLGAQPAAGRLLREEDDVPKAPNRIVISHRLWRTRYGAQPGIVGTQIRSGGQSFTVVGVTSGEFDFPRDVDVWLPLHVGWPTVDQTDRLRVFRAVGLMRPGVKIGQLRAQMSVVARQMADAAPPGSGQFGMLVTPMLDEIYGSTRLAIWIIGGAVALVLLISCANAANLMMARSAARSRELAVRTALGAGRGELIRLLLGEGLVLAIAAGLAGLVLAKLGIGWLQRWAPAEIPRLETIELAWPVVLFGMGLTLLTVLLFAWGPAWMASRQDPQEALQQAGTRLSAGRPAARLRELLIVGEVALSIVLLVSAGLLLRTFSELARLDPGFEPANVLTFRVTLAKPDQESRRAFYGAMLEKLRALPGVRSAGAILLRPLSGSVGWDTVYALDRQTPEEVGRNPNGNYEAVSPEYFRTMGITLRAGRDFTAADQATAPGVVIVNESTAQRHWPGMNAVGQRLRLGRGANLPWLTVIGVVKDVRYREWEAVRPDFYVPYTQRAQHRSDFVVKTQGDPAALVSAVRNVVHELDPNQAISNVTTMESLVDRALARARLNGAVLATLAACALLLVTIGLYGLLSYTVMQRRGEIGIRLAIGASPAQMVQMIASFGARLTAVGAVVGLLAAWMLTRLYTSLLFGVSPLDARSYGMALAGLFAVALTACAIPARQAAKVDPLRTLQSQ